MPLSKSSWLALRLFGLSNFLSLSQGFIPSDLQYHPDKDRCTSLLKRAARLSSSCARSLKNVFQKSLNVYSIESLSFCAFGGLEGQTSPKVLVMGVRLTGYHHSVAHEVVMVISSTRASPFGKMRQV